VIRKAGRSGVALSQRPPFVTEDDIRKPEDVQLKQEEPCPRYGLE
jgi:hypothetical protein